MRCCVLVLLILLVATTTDARPHRSRQATADFQRASPCPATGQSRGRCPGYVIDHLVPLCAGGPDAAANMQWQTVADAKIKDRAEAAQCRARQ